jgi:hypothetical protein
MMYAGGMPRLTAELRPLKLPSMIFREYISHLLRQSYVSIRRPNRHRNDNQSETPRLQPEEKHVVEAEAHAARRALR